MKRSAPIALLSPKRSTFLLAFIIPFTLCLLLLAVLLRSDSLLLLLALGGVMVAGMVFVAGPSPLVYLVPFLVAVEYRIRFSWGSFTVAELSAALLCLVFFFRLVKGRAAQWPGFSRDSILVSLVAFFALPSILFLRNLQSAASVYRDLILPLVFYLAFRAANLERRQVQRLVQLFVLVVTAGAVLGIVQYFTGEYLFFQSEEDAIWQPFKLRVAHGSVLSGWLGLRNTLAVGFFSSVNNFGTYLVIPICVTLAWTVSRSLSWKEKLLWFSCTVLQMAALVFTFFRSGFLTVGVSSLLILWFRKRQITSRSVLVLGLAALALLLATLQTETLNWDQYATLQGRGSMVRDALDLIVHHPVAILTGGYTEIYQRQYVQFQAIHNIGLYLIVQFGLPTALALLAFYVGSLRDCSIAVNCLSGKDRDLALGIFTGVSSTMFILAQTTSFLDSVQNSMWLLFWLGIGTYLYAFQHLKSLPCRRPPPLPALPVKPGDGRRLAQLTGSGR